MILKKNTIKRALLCVLLVATLTLAAIGMAVTTYAAGPYDLTMDVDSHTASVSVSYQKGDGTPFNELYTDDFVINEIPFDADVLIRITPKDGYTLNTVVGVDTTSNPTVSASPVGEADKPYFEFTIGSINSNCSYEVTCTERTFYAVLKPSDYAPAGATSIDYTVTGIENSTPFTYGVSPKIAFPVPVKSGYKFLHWEARGAAGEVYTLINHELPSNYTNNLALKTDEISIYPVFEKILFEVTRNDYVYQSGADKYQGKLLGSFTWEALKATIVDGLTATSTGDPAANGYAGYRVCKEELDADVIAAIRDYTKITVAPTVEDAYGNPHQNIVSRYYLPIVYSLSYNVGGGTNAASPVSTHTYDQETALPTPTRRGHSFAGWNVTVGGVVVEEKVFSLDAENPAYANGNSADAITLVAVWEPNNYDIEYVLGDDGAIANEAPANHLYGVDTALTAPTRPGYYFKGWQINGSNQTVDDVLPADTIGKNDGDTIELTAIWEPKQFLVQLGINVGETGDTVLYLEDGRKLREEKMVFGSSCADLSFLLLPERAGYTFKGFYTAMDGGECYIDANGRGLDVKWALDDADDDGFVMLYAQWEPNPYEISLSYDPALVQSVTVNGVLYNLGDMITVRYRVPVEIVVNAIDGYKVVTWNGADEVHANAFVKNYRHETVGAVYGIQIVILPATAAQSASVNLITEKLLAADGSNLPTGAYGLYIDGAFWCEAVVGADGTITVDGKRVDAIRMIDACYGHELQIVTRGTRGVTADSDPFVIALPARPDAPAMPEYSVEIEPERILLTILSDNAGQYQFSISKDPTTPGRIWQDSTVLDRLSDGSALEPGTTYYVFVRIRGSETVPASCAATPPLAFRTEPVTDEISLILPIICLGATLLCQLVAIGLLLNRRRSAKKNVTLNGFAPIAMLAIRFRPAEGLVVVLALAALVIIAQIVLIYLLATSDLIRRSKRVMSEEDADEQDADDAQFADDEQYVPAQEESEEAETEGYDEDAAMHVFDEPAEREEEPVLTTLIDADVADPGVGDDTYHLTYESAESESLDEENDALFAEFDEEAPIAETADETAIATDEEATEAASYYAFDEDAEEPTDSDADEDAMETDVPVIDPEADIDDSVFAREDEDELPDIDDSDIDDSELDDSEIDDSDLDD